MWLSHRVVGGGLTPRTHMDPVEIVLGLLFGARV